MSKRSVEQGPDRRLEMVGSYSPVPPPPEPGAEDELQRAERLVIEGERAGLDDLEMGMRLGDMVRICFARQAWAEAVPPLTRLLALNRAQGDDRPEVATVLSSLATARYALGEHNEAAQLWEEALEIRERWLVPNHFMIARSVENLADARVAQGRMDEALALLRRALGIWQQTLPPSDPTVRAIRTKIGDLQLSSSQELPVRGPSGARPPAAPAPIRLGGYSREPMGPQGVQSSRELSAAAAPEPLEAPRIAGAADHSSAGPPTAAAPLAAPLAAAPLMPEVRFPEAPRVAEVAPVLPPPRETRIEPSMTPPEAVVSTRPSGAPLASPFLVDLDAPNFDVPPADETTAGEPERPLLSRNWLQLGRSLALSAPDEPPAYPADPDEESESFLGGLRAARVPRPAAVGIAVLAVVLFGAYRLAGTEPPAPSETASILKRVGAQTSSVTRPSATPNAVAPSLVRESSAGSVALAGDRRSAPPARAAPDETETTARDAAREAGRARSAAAAAAAAGGAAPTGMPGALSAELANTMRAVESTTVVGSDSAVKQMLYGRALGLSTETDLAASKRSAASATARPAAVEDPRDMKSAMLAPGGVQPVFPFQLLSENVTGNVVIEVLVDATGRADARTARVVRSSHPLFTAAVMRALPTMRFVPAEAHGQKVAQRIEVPFRFDRKAAGQ